MSAECQALHGDHPPVDESFVLAVSSNPITNDAEFAAALGERVEVPAEKWVEFRVVQNQG